MDQSAPNKKQKLDVGQASLQVSPHNHVSPLRSFEQSYVVGNQTTASPNIFDALASVNRSPITAAPAPSALDTTLTLSASAHLEMLSVGGMSAQLGPTLGTFAAYDDPVFSSDSNNLIWSALGAEYQNSDQINGGNDIPWILDLWPDATQSDPVQSMFGFVGDNFQGLPQGSANIQGSSLSTTADVGGRDVNFLAALLQEVQPRTEAGADSSKIRTRAPTPTRSGERSRAVSPAEGRAAEDDKWPMNWHPRGQQYSIGKNVAPIISLNLSEVDPSLHKWSRFWLDQDIYDKVTACFALAKASPGPDVSQLILPQSLNTVNTCISLYFECFSDELPILHLPTFVPAKAPPLLLAALICIGACYAELPGARDLALDLIEAIRKTLNALFEHDARNLRSVSLIHVYLLNVLAGLFIGNKRTYEMAEASRGTLINLCRRAELLSSATSVPNLSSGDVTSRWHTWVSFESRKRLGMGICLLDTVFPALLDIPAYHSHRDMLNLVMPCSDEFWTAPTARSWSGLLGLASTPPSPFFITCIVPLLLPHISPTYGTAAYKPVHHLSSLSALIVCSALHHHVYEFRTHLSCYLAAGMEVPILTTAEYGKDLSMGFGFEGRREWLTEALQSWNKHYYVVDSTYGKAGKLLYHLGHLSLYIYVGGLYDAIGKRGEVAAKSAQLQLKEWVSGKDAEHAISHALQMLQLLPDLERTMYYPLCGFVAVLTLAMYARYVELPKLATFQEDAALKHFLGITAGAGASTLSLSSRICGKGAELLSRGKAWRIGSALALILAKQAE